MKITFKMIVLGLLISTLLCGVGENGEVSAAAENSQDYLANTALLIIDIQNDYFPGGKFELLDSESASLKAKELLIAFRKKQVPIIHIRHENLGSDATFFVPGTTGAAIHHNVAPQANELVVLKHDPNSFIGTNLAGELQKRGVNNLIICGMQTNVCVRATVLDGLRRGYRVTVAEDALAARVMGLHQTAIREMKTAHAIFINSDDLIKDL